MRRKVTFGGREVMVEFDYDRGEPQWFDAKAGVGSPGFPPSVEVVGFELDGEYTSLADIEQQLIDAICAEERETDAVESERYWEQLAEDKRLAREGEV